MLHTLILNLNIYCTYITYQFDLVKSPWNSKPNQMDQFGNISNRTEPQNLKNRIEPLKMV